MKTGVDRSREIDFSSGRRLLHFAKLDFLTEQLRVSRVLL
jgi:hypothetical protein